MLLAGFGFVRRDPYVGPMTAYLSPNNVCVQAFQTALLIFLLRELDVGPGTVGVVVAAVGVGFLIGAGATPALGRVMGIGSTVIAASLVGGLGMMAVVVRGPGIMMPLLGAAGAGLGTGLYNLHSIAIRQTVTPDDLLGRVNAVVKIVSYTSMAVGAFLGGYISERLTADTAILAAGIGSVLSTVFLFPRAVRRLKNLPHTDTASD